MMRQKCTDNFEAAEIQAARMFTRIVGVARRYMEVFDYDYENHKVCGLLKTRSAGQIAVLAFDASKGTLAVFVNFPTPIELTMARVMILFRLQNRAANGSSSIHLDPESSTLQVQAHAKLPAPSVVQPIVAAALRDAVRVIENDDFRKFVN